MVCFPFRSLGVPLTLLAYGCNLIIEHILYSAGRILIAMLPPVSQLVLYISLKSLNESPVFCSACWCCCCTASINTLSLIPTLIFISIFTQNRCCGFSLSLSVCLQFPSFFRSFTPHSRFIFVGLTANYQFQMIEKTTPITFIVDRPLKHTYTVTRCDNQWKYLWTKWFSGNWEYQAHAHSLALFIHAVWPRLES